MIEKNKNGTYSLNVHYREKMWADMELYGCEEHGPKSPKHLHRRRRTICPHVEKRRRAGKAYINSKKTPCENCGSTEEIEFHHVDKHTKYHNVGSLANYNYKIIQAEIDKCICLCRTCHTKHHRENDWYWETSKPIK